MIKERGTSICPGVRERKNMIILKGGAPTKPRGAGGPRACRPKQSVEEGIPSTECRKGGPDFFSIEPSGWERMVSSAARLPLPEGGAFKVGRSVYRSTRRKDYIK